MADDLTHLLSTIRNPEKSHVDTIKRRSMGTTQWFLERDVETQKIYNNNSLQFFVCGEEGFRNIQKDILAARYSIDLVLWGFDPGMELIRENTLPSWPRGSTRYSWPRGMTYGDLLTKKARDGVKVRLLLWFPGNALENFADNLHDLGLVSPIPPFWGFRNNTYVVPDTEMLDVYETLEARGKYSRAWMTHAIRGHFQNLEVRFRDDRIGDVLANSEAYLPSLRESYGEAISATAAGTHHQKPVLIDYGTPKDGNTCAYVMGLNSVTSYWDSDQHLFNDPRREVDEKTSPGFRTTWHIKPYRDYAVRISGEALHSINANFVEGWDGAQGYAFGHGSGALKRMLAFIGVHENNPSSPLTGKNMTAERSLIQAKDLPVEPGARSRVQILRTFPEKKEATILKAYTLASSNAINYIYVENQYVQLTEWPRLLKKTREDYIRGMMAGGASPSDITPLHVFIVMPQPERNEVVPNTYDTIAPLGAGDSMKNYHALVQGEREGKHSLNPIRAAARSAKTVPLDPSKELNALGINVLVAMLMTYDKKGEAEHLRYKGKRESEAQTAEAKLEKKKNKAQNIHEGEADDVDLAILHGPKPYDEFNLKPRAYREIYIHSKLMLVDDTFLTVGSANLNPRSMVGDSEFNMCTDDQAFVQKARQRVWGNLAGNDLSGADGSPGDVLYTHSRWRRRMEINRDNRKRGLSPEGDSFIHKFEDVRKDSGIRFA